MCSIISVPDLDSFVKPDSILDGLSPDDQNLILVFDQNGWKCKDS